MTYEKLPCAGCREYGCDVAKVDPPDGYFDWILTCYTLAQSGFKIENNQLSLDEWRDLGMMKSLLEAKKDRDNLSMVSHEMVDAFVKMRGMAR